MPQEKNAREDRRDDQHRERYTNASTTLPGYSCLPESLWSGSGSLSARRRRLAICIFQV